jgi:hypothetical protein
MKKVELKDVKPHSAAKHFNSTALKPRSKDETGSTKIVTGLSHFLQRGGKYFIC